MSIYEKLHTIQKTLKAPKNQYNKFGNYKYRSCEDIVESVKPLLPDGTFLLLSDEVVQIGDRFYVKAEAALVDEKQRVNTYAYAREPLDKKGMDASQITGASSSYARKYALNGLFSIDDTKDADTDEHAKKIKDKGMIGNYTPPTKEENNKDARKLAEGWLKEQEVAINSFPDANSLRSYLVAIGEKKKGHPFSPIEKLERNHPDLHKKLMDIYEDRLNALKLN